MIKYLRPNSWIKFDKLALFDELTSAKAAVLSLTSIPYQRNWVESLQYLTLKREVAGTSRIEGAQFTEAELEKAIDTTVEDLITRSQRQARAAIRAYRWIADLQDDCPINLDLVMMIHRLVVEGADDDHCEPGKLRSKDENVTFGVPKHRGADGGDECKEVFNELLNQASTVFREHDPLIQALAVHYHFASIHPFSDGNGRTARALEALILQRAGLRDTSFIAMSNYYYDEKNNYLAALSSTRAANHDLTEFLRFGLRGIATQCDALRKEINLHISRSLYKEMMFKLFNKLKTSRKRVIQERQLIVLKMLLGESRIQWEDLIEKADHVYVDLKNPLRALVRDINQLGHLGAIHVWKDDEDIFIQTNLAWPSEISESDFMNKLRELPTAKTYDFL